MRLSIALWVSGIYLFTGCGPEMTQEPVSSKGTSTETCGQEEGVRFARNTFAPEEVHRIYTEAEIDESARLVNAMKKPEVGTARAYADGRVYNVTAPLGVNIRSGPGTNYSVVRVASAGADLLNDASGGIVNASGYSWVRVTYAFGSTDPCNTQESKGWVVVDHLNPGTVHVNPSQLNIRSSPCNGSIIGTVGSGTVLNFFDPTNQWRSKWYVIRVPNTGYPGTIGYVDGWDFTDVY